MRASSSLATLAAIGIVATYYVGRFRDCVLVFFALDDFWELRDAARIHIGSLADLAQFFRLPANGFLLYRPLTTSAYFYVLRMLFGVDSTGYHAVQLLAHIVNALLVFAIARRLTESPLAGIAAAIIYAAAPGHMGAIYPMCNFTVTGTVTAVFALLYLWLRTDGVARAVGCTILQVVGLLASEHAVVTPVLLALIAVVREPRQSRRQAMWQLSGPFILTGGYLLLKIYYLVSRPFAGPEQGYVPSLNPFGALLGLGKYAVAAFNVSSLLPLGDAVFGSIGVVVILATAFAGWQALRQRNPGWDLLALGCAIFVVGLLPVLPLSAHFYAHYIGIAALGSALAAVGMCRLLTRRWRGLAAAFAAGIVLLELATAGRAARTDPVYVLYREAAYWSAGWVESVRQAGDDGKREVFVPRNPLTAYVFAIGQAQQVFGANPPQVVFYEPGEPPAAAPGRAVLSDPPATIAADSPLPGWQSRWNWLRRGARRG